MPTMQFACIPGPIAVMHVACYSAAFHGSNVSNGSGAGAPYEVLCRPRHDPQAESDNSGKQESKLKWLPRVQWIPYSLLRKLILIG